MPELKEVIEKQKEICKLVSDIQSEVDKSKEDGIALKKMEADIEKMVESTTKLSEDFVAEENAREQLESIVARINEPVVKDREKSLSHPEYHKSFQESLRKNAPSVDLKHHQDEVRAMVDFYAPAGTKDDDIDFMVKTLSVGVQSDGGYFVPIDPLRKITERVWETSPMRQISSVITTANEAITVGLDDDEPDSGWVSEYATRTETGTPKIGELTINTHEQYAYPKATMKMIEDAGFNVENWLIRKVGTRFGRIENTAFVNGTGNKQPRGWNTLDEWANNEVYQREALASQITASATSVVGDDLIDLQSLLLEEFQNNARWAMHRKIWAGITKLKDGVSGGYLISPLMLFNGVDMQLLGKPITMMGDMPAVVADGGFPVAYGDWEEGYTIVDRIGVKVIKDDITSPGFVKWHLRKRVGGDVTNYQAIKRLKVKAA